MRLYDSVIEAFSKSDAGPHASGSSGGQRLPYASEALGCGRAIGLRLLDFRGKSISDSSSVTMGIGRYMHAVTQQAAREAVEAAWQRRVEAGQVPDNLAAIGPNFRPEVSWRTDYCSGRADGLYADPEWFGDGVKLRVLEIKTTSKWAFEHALDHGPSDNHIMQAWLSASHFGAEEAHVLYVNKQAAFGSPPVAEWFLPLDQDAVAMEEARLRSIAFNASGGIISEPVDGRGDSLNPFFTRYPCQYCAFADLCKEMPAGLALDALDYRR